MPNIKIIRILFNTVYIVYLKVLCPFPDSVSSLNQSQPVYEIITFTSPVDSASIAALLL
jgi:hypothetical protein